MDRDYHKIDGVAEGCAPIRIGDNVWIGCQATIMKGVTIAPGAVVAACSVVTHDVPPRAVVAGNPAQVVRDEVHWAP